MSNTKVRIVLLKKNYMHESLQRELTAYRKLGSLQELRCLKHSESCRRDNINYLHKVINNLLGVAMVMAGVVVTLFIMVILA